MEGHVNSGINNLLSLSPGGAGTGAEIPCSLRDIQVLKMAQHILVEIHRSSADTQVLRVDTLGGTLLSLAAAQALKPDTLQATLLLWEAVQVLKKAMDS
jgi:hypothetical protein